MLKGERCWLANHDNLYFSSPVLVFIQIVTYLHFRVPQLLTFAHLQRNNKRTQFLNGTWSKSHKRTIFTSLRQTATPKPAQRKNLRSVRIFAES